MMRALLDNQSNAITKLQKVKVGALFMEPGTGKTRTSIELVNSIKEADRVFYIGPFQGIYSENYKESIKSEVCKWGGFDATTSYSGVESYSNSDRIYLETISEIERSKKPVIIVDEGLKIKNADAKRTKRLLHLSQLVDYKLLLNGTPLSKNLLDLWTQMEFLSPRILNMSQSQFKNTFVEYTTVTKRLGNRSLTKEYINRYHNLDYLYKLIEPYVFEADLDLKIKRQYIDIDYSLTEEELHEHNEIKAKYLDDERMEFRNNNIFLEISQKLQHNYSLSPEKLSIIDNVLKKHPINKVAIVAKYIDTQEYLKKYYPDLRVLSWQKNAYALNMQQYNVLIKFDKHWDYALHDQLEHRFYRTGQTDDLIIYDLKGNVGLEDLMQKNVEKKGLLLQLFKEKAVKELIKKL